MATFADYPQQTMASNNDFTLYPYQWNDDQSYLPVSTYSDQAYMNANAFDPYQTTQGFPQMDQFSFGMDQTFQSKSTLQPPSPNYSPANSASHSFDLHPPILSSTSDSGASVPSTISSAMGSPSVQPQPSNDWSQQQNMGMLPGIVQQDNLGQDVFATTGFDLETIPVTDKGCVGELTAISSSQQASNVSSSNFSLSSSFDLLRDSGSYSQTVGMDNWSMPLNALPAGSVGQPMLSIPSQTAPGGDNTSPSDSVFKSPTTPASAAATSPVIERVKGKRKASVAAAAPKRVRGSSPLNQAMSYHESDLPQRPQAPPPTFTSPFFTQSSGYFVPPLESSCPSPTSLSLISDFLVSFVAEKVEHLLTYRFQIHH